MADPAPREIWLSAFVKLDEAIRRIKWADEAVAAGKLGAAEMHARRAGLDLLYAEQSARTALARWHEYEERHAAALDAELGAT